MARLLASGAVAPIVTPEAVLEGGVWPTFLTSQSPATHGMFAYQQLKRGTYDLEVALHADRLPVPPFWEHLSRAGKRVTIIDAPFARTAKRLNGMQVTNWGAHDAWSWARSSYPASLIDDLVRRFGDHPVPSCNLGRKRTAAEYQRFREHLIEGVRRKTALLRHCLELEDWDLFLGVYSESHCVGHHFWHFLDPGHPRHDPSAAQELATAILDVYREIDTGIAALLEHVSADSHALVMLSHGMGPFYAGAHLLQPVLDRLGMSGMVPSASDSSVVEQSTWKLRHLVPARVRRHVKGWLPRLASALWRQTHHEVRPWERARAFAVPEHYMTSGIRINLRGREPAGTVEPGAEHEALCRELTEVLLSLEFPIRAVRSPRIGTVAEDFPFERSGDHRSNGLLAGLGPRFQSGEIKNEVRTEDIAPTVLEFFGVPIPSHYEGRSVGGALFNGASVRHSSPNTRAAFP